MDAWESELVEAIARLSRERFAERAATHDREGSFPHENIAELKDLGVPGMALPKALGGLNIGAEAHMRVVEEIAYGDASTAVALNMHLLVADLLKNIPIFARGNQVLEDVARNGALLCAPGSIPISELDNRKSGYTIRDEGEQVVIDGRSGFASMSDGATYVFIGGRVPRGDDQESDLALCLPEKSSPGLRVLNNWDAMGLRGTASHDIVCEDVRIPKAEAAIIPAPVLRVMLQTEGSQGGVTQNRARGALGILAIWLGAAQSAFDFTVEYVAQRHGYLAVEGVSALGASPGYRSGEAWAQIDIGQMDHWLGTGRVLFYEMVRSIEEQFADPQDFIRKLVRTVYHLRRMSEEIAMGAMKVCGAHAYVKNRPLERIVRDLIGGNVMAWKTDQLAQTLGQGALGLPIRIVGPAGA